MKSIDVDSRTTRAIDFNTSTEVVQPKSLVADGMERAGYSIQTRDYCDGVVEFGDRTGNTAGVYVEEKDPSSGLYAQGRSTPLLLDAEIRDNNDGSYSYDLRTVNSGIFSLYVSYGDSDKKCTFDVSTSSEDNYTAAILLGVDTAGIVNLATEPKSTPDGCFYGVVKRGIVAVPLTQSTTSTPTAFDLKEADNNAVIVLVGSIGGGICGLGGTVALALYLVYRRRWVQVKHYIADGEAYKMNLRTNYQPDAEHASTTSYVHNQTALKWTDTIFGRRGPRTVSVPYLEALPVWAHHRAPGTCSSSQQKN